VFARDRLANCQFRTRSGVRYAYSSNGQGIYAIDMHTGTEGETLAYPTPDQLWRCPQWDARPGKAGCQFLCVASDALKGVLDSNLRGGLHGLGLRHWINTGREDLTSFAMSFPRLSERDIRILAQ